MWSIEEKERVCKLAESCLGATYAIGGLDPVSKAWVVRGKPGIEEDPHKTGADCSGFSRWLIGQGIARNTKRVILPHGCIAQLEFCKEWPLIKPELLALGFADLSGQDKAPDHVVVVLNSERVIEARGKPYGKVITRPISAWEKQQGFLGWWGVPGVHG